MYSSGALKSQIRGLTKSRKHSVSIVVSLQAQVHNQPLSRLELQTAVAGSILIISPDILPLHFFTALLKIKFNKDTLPTANFHSSPVLHTAGAEFSIPSQPHLSLFSLTEDSNSQKDKEPLGECPHLGFFCWCQDGSGDCKG